MSDPVCPACAASGAALGPRLPGGLAVCLICGEVAIVTPELGLRPFVPEDLDTHSMEELTRAVRTAIEIRSAYERSN